jgi:hypothetical protein
MREKLGKLHNQRKRFTAHVKRFGTKPAYRGYVPIKTVLLVDITDETGTIVADHMWMTVGKQLEDLSAAKGDKIAFHGRVTTYLKGYAGRDEDGIYGAQEVDFRISNPTKFEHLEIKGVVLGD